MTNFLHDDLHDEVYQKIVAMLGMVRRKQGLTQRLVARRLNKPQSYIAKIEGCGRRLDLVEFIMLARALEVDPHMLFGVILKEIGKD